MILRWYKMSHWTMWLKSVASRVVVMDFGGERCHVRQILHVSTMSLTSASALGGAPASLKSSSSLAVAACQSRTWSLRIVRFTTLTSVL